MLRILTDTGADLYRSEAEAMGVELILLPIEFPDGPFEQAEAEDFRRFYQKLEDGAGLPTTSQPAFGDLIARFQDIRDRGDEALVLLLSPKISGAYESALKARDLVGYDRIHIINTRVATLAQQLLLRSLVQWRDAGDSVETLLKKLDDAISRLWGLAYAGSLTYLRKGGRIPASLAILGNLVRIKPLLYFTEDGTLELLDKNRGQKASRASLLNHFLDHDIDETKPILVAYTTERPVAEELGEQLRETFPDAAIHITQIGGVVGTHLGPGSLGIAGYTKEPWRKE